MKNKEYNFVSQELYDKYGTCTKCVVHLDQMTYSK